MDFPGADYDDQLQRGMDRGLSDPDELEVEYAGPKPPPQRRRTKQVQPYRPDDDDINW